MKAPEIIALIDSVQPGKYHLMSAADEDDRPKAVVCIVGVASGDDAVRIALTLQRALTPTVADPKPLIEP